MKCLFTLVSKTTKEKGRLFFLKYKIQDEDKWNGREVQMKVGDVFLLWNMKHDDMVGR